MGDCDGSYDFYNIDNFINGLETGYDLVIGNRFLGNIEKDAMPFSNKIGTKFLTNIANLFFHTNLHDYNCGLRAYKLDSIKKLKLNQPGMEYASEMIIKANIYSIFYNISPNMLKYSN